MHGGEIYVKKIPSMNIVDIATAIAPEAKRSIIGIRPGEKLHEQMIGADDAPHTFEYQDHFKILPEIHRWSSDPYRIKDGKRVPDGFVYSSDSNKEWMSIEQLREWVSRNHEKIGRV